MTAVDQKDSIAIRPANPGDYAAWLPLWRGYQSFYKVDIAQSVTDTTWARFHDPAEPLWAALAWKGDAAVGMVHWIFHRSTWTVGDYCYLQDLFVDGQIRGGGIGRSLISRVYDEARQAGCSRVYWLTHETNTSAMALYDKVADKSGFVQYRRQF